MSRGKLRIKDESSDAAEAREMATMDFGEDDAAPASPPKPPPAATSADFVTLKLADIDTSPTNPRKDFNKEKLQQLAADITARGVLQPVTVRKKGDRYELVFGERRYRASKLAGVESVPALVRQLTDEQALEAQLSENTGEPLSPVELAFGYQQLREKEKLTVDQLAAKVGRSRIAVYNTLKLLELSADGKKALEAGEISASVAELVARVPAPLQGQALARVRGNANPNRHGETVEPLSVRSARRELAHEFTRDLKKAPFNTEDAALCPKAGACGACPRRSGNAPEYGDLNKPDLCTDVACFTEKVRAAAAAKLAKKGYQLLSKDETAKFFRHGHFYVDEHATGYVDPGNQDWDDSKRRTHRELLTPEQYKDLVRVAVQDDGTEHEVLAKNGLAAAKKKAGIIKSRPERSSSSSSSVSKPREYKPPEPTLEEKQLDACIDALVKVVEKKGLSSTLMKLIAAEMIWATEHLELRRGLKRKGYGRLSVKEFEKHLSNPTPAQVAGIVFEATVLDRIWADGDDVDGLKDVAQLLGVDLKKVCKETKEAEEAKTIGGRPITHINGKPVKPAKVPHKKVTKAVAAIAKASKKSSKKKAA